MTSHNNDTGAQDDIINAVLWKLYLIPDDSDAERYRQIWDEQLKEDPQLYSIIYCLASTFRTLLVRRLAPELPEASAISGKLLSKLKGASLGGWLEALTQPDALRPEEVEQLKDIVRTVIQSALQPKSVTLPPIRPAGSSPTSAQMAVDSSEQETVDDKQPDDEKPSEESMEDVLDGDSAEKGDNDVRSPTPDSEQTLKQNQESPISPAAAQWQYKAVAHRELDLHEESYADSIPALSGFKLVGARVRGKKHKHDGTNCDDWFEYTLSGNWTIIAVSDGAGSKQFSRVGSKVSCRAAVAHLKAALQDHHISSETLTAPEKINRDATGKFTQPDVEKVQASLHEAIHEAYSAVEQAAEERNQQTRYWKYLNSEYLNSDKTKGGETRELQMSDLSATLLLVVQTTVTHNNKDYSLILTCQVGDGTIAAISQSSDGMRTKVLGMSDSGEFAGQTEFLTSKGKLEKAHLIHKTFLNFTPLKALFVMTDGVADDYFPAEQGIKRLYGDLLLNRILACPVASPEDIQAALKNTPIHSLDGINEARSQFQTNISRITAPEDPLKEVTLSSLTEYARQIDVSEAEILESTALLTAAFVDPPLLQGTPEDSPAERLRIWLDSYQVRSSFDDRTLVVLYRED